MNRERTIFSQILDFLPKYEFDKCVERYQGNHKILCAQQTVGIQFARLASRVPIFSGKSGWRSSFFIFGDTLSVFS